MAKRTKLSYYEDGWPDDEDSSERYLEIDDGSRLVILGKGVYVDIDIIIETEERLNEWISILKRAWKIKLEQDQKGWRKRE